jgi:hypothetical protein
MSPKSSSPFAGEPPSWTTPGAAGFPAYADDMVSASLTPWSGDAGEAPLAGWEHAWIDLGGEG